MKNFSIKIGFLFIISTMGWTLPVDAAPPDIYIVYVNSEKVLKNSLKIKLSKRHGLKIFNASSLAMADYSGTQKAISKLSTAKLVLMLTDSPLALFNNHQFENTLVVSGDSEDDIAKIIAKIN